MCFEYPQTFRCTWNQWHWKPVHSPYQQHPHHCLQKCIEFSLATAFNALDMNLSIFVCWLSYVDIARFKIWRLDFPVCLLKHFMPNFAKVFLEVIFGCWWGSRWSLYRLCWCATNYCLVVGGNLSDSPRRFELFLDLDGHPDFLQWILFFHLRLGIFTNLGEIISFALRCSAWNCACVHHANCSRSAAKRTPFQIPHPTAYQVYSRSISDNTVFPNWWNLNGSKTVMEWYSTNDPNDFKWFVEAPFVRWSPVGQEILDFSADGCNIMEFVHQFFPSVVDCNSIAKDVFSLQRAAIEQSKVFLNGEVSTFQ